MHYDLCHSVCGDKFVVGLELCDDGNTADNIGCKSDCSGSLDGYDCNSLIPNPTLIQNGTLYCTNICNDGLIVLQESCDDKDIDDGDGCSSIC